MRRLKVEYALSAERDFRATLDFLERIGASEARALSFVQQLRAACERIGYTPYIGTARDELLPGLRTVGYRRRATIVFRVLADRVQIVNVFYGGRDIEGFYRRQRGEEA